MKLIHCADLHLDSRMNTHLTKEQAKERRQEMLRTFTRMVDYASQYDIDVILIAGDLFDTKSVSATTRNIVRDAILSHPDIDFLYLRGNHDNDNFLGKLPEIPDNLKLFDDNWKSYRYGKVVITGVELSSQNQAYIYNSLALDHNVYNIVTLHGQLMDYKSRDDAEVISLNDLKNKNIDYLALGHIHAYKKDQLDARGIYCYSGCLEGRGFDECGEKGFVRLDIDESTCTARMKFIPAAQRNLYAIPVDVTGVMTTQEAAKRIEETLSGVTITQKSLVRFDLVGEVEVDAEINCDFLQEMFSEYFYYEKVVDKTRMLVDFAAYEKDVSLKGEFIRMIMQSDMPEDKKTEVIRCGILALSGEEI